MFQHHEINRNKKQENKRQESKEHNEFVDPVR
jgi:hypothetical protein